MAFTVLRSGDEQQVNTLTRSNQVQPTIARLNDGGWVVSWTGQDSNQTGIYMQRYNSAGEAQFTSGGRPADRLVNHVIEGSQIWSAVTGLSDGGWLVTWIDTGSDTPGVIYQHRYNAQGAIQNIGQTIVNPGRPAEESNNIEITALPQGEWLITWESSDGLAEKGGVYQQRFSASGNPLIAFDDQRVNVKFQGAQSFADVTALAQGGWLVTWIDGGPFDKDANIHWRR